MRLMDSKGSWRIKTGYKRRKHFSFRFHIFSTSSGWLNLDIDWAILTDSCPENGSKVTIINHPLKFGGKVKNHKLLGLVSIFAAFSILLTSCSSSENKAGEESAAPVTKYVPTGKYVINPQYSNVNRFSDGLAAVQQNGLWGYVGIDGKMAIEPQFDYAYSFTDGKALVALGSGEDAKYGFIDKTGLFTLNPTFDDAWFFSEGLVSIGIRSGNKTKYGYVDSDGKYVINPQYDASYGFSEGLASYRFGDYDTGKWGFIDKTGKEVTPAQFQEVTDYKNGFAIVGIESKVKGKTVLRYGAIDTTGKYVINPTYEAMGSYSGESIPS
jgi:hypothetical protein